MRAAALESPKESPKSKFESRQEGKEAKESFDIERAVHFLREAGRALPKAAMFALRDEGYDSVFEQLVACIISIRTRDETTLPTARKLLSKARSPQAISVLGETAIDHIIEASTFHRTKAKAILEIARRVEKNFGGVLPADRELLLSLPGVGPKCANLTLGVACDERRIAVDIHVHRVANRWGYVQTTTPEKTLAALEARLPKRYWSELNALSIGLCVQPVRSYRCAVKSVCEIHANF